MAAILWSDVVGVAPELTTIVVGTQNDILGYVNDAINVDGFKGGETSAQLRLARIFMAAHFGASVGMGAASGPITQETGGGLSEQYALLMTTELLESTFYGRQYRAIMRTSASRAFVVIKVC